VVGVLRSMPQPAAPPCRSLLPCRMRVLKNTSVAWTGSCPEASVQPVCRHQTVPSMAWLTTALPVFNWYAMVWAWDAPRWAFLARSCGPCSW
jgi:hypothetical protein